MAMPAASAKGAASASASGSAEAGSGRKLPQLPPGAEAEARAGAKNDAAARAAVTAVTAREVEASLMEHLALRARDAERTTAKVKYALTKSKDVSKAVTKVVKELKALTKDSMKALAEATAAMQSARVEYIARAEAAETDEITLASAENTEARAKLAERARKSQAKKAQAEAAYLRTVSEFNMVQGSQTQMVLPRALELIHSAEEMRLQSMRRTLDDVVAALNHDPLGVGASASGLSAVVAALVPLDDLEVWMAPMWELASVQPPTVKFHPYFGDLFRAMFNMPLAQEKALRRQRRRQRRAMAAAGKQVTVKPRRVGGASGGDETPAAAPSVAAEGSDGVAEPVGSAPAQGTGRLALVARGEVRRSVSESSAGMQRSARAAQHSTGSGAGGEGGVEGDAGDEVRVRGSRASSKVSTIIDRFSVLETKVESVEETMYGSRLVVRGWLRKKGARVRSWKRRFFVMQGRSILYFKKAPPRGKESVSDAAGLIHISPSMTVNKASYADASKTFLFEITVPDRTYLIQAGDEKELHRWIVLIRRFIQDSIDLSSAAMAPPISHAITAAAATKGSPSPASPVAHQHSRSLSSAAFLDPESEPAFDLSDDDEDDEDEEDEVEDVAEDGVEDVADDGVEDVVGDVTEDVAEDVAEVDARDVAEADAGDAAEVEVEADAGADAKVRAASESSGSSGGGSGAGRGGSLGLPSHVKQRTRSVSDSRVRRTRPDMEGNAQGGNIGNIGGGGGGSVETSTANGGRGCVADDGGSSACKSALQQFSTSLRMFCDCVLNHDGFSLVPSLTCLLMDFKPLATLFRKHNIDFSETRDVLSSLVAHSRPIDGNASATPDAWRSLKLEVRGLVKSSRELGDMLIEAEGEVASW
ncbi:uncharacterized protein AMSG_09089 [Thecamonas trahens ATCC 50062]|uniref:PH domain-containing protein n=1 Tax=Thecamonas trahens ATCC 50062 TaxID=461836 RepID=A0A0L0DKT5_THETB|nr:hypothetical protein AMSG_09089 [Thecamonas trahens ATCC 50062]KNC52922.1 hypothetical protein AMSG_09089 [Thecamonas trahens ATCC 50062]|eukprot:XP_013754818.1 hypothetical protein AMSG_09089 [Thecamonas trahens ATCC 50062]